MRITTTIAPLIVDAETVIPLSITNPMFENQGSHSLPFSVPHNPHNLRALGLPVTSQKGTKSGQTISATLVAHPLHEEGELTVQEVSHGERIELSFTTREGMFYDWANRTMLKELEFEVVESTNAAGVANAMFSQANQPYPQSKWAMFPVIIDKNRVEGGRYTKNLTSSASFYEDEYEYFRMLNEPDPHGLGGVKVDAIRINSPVRNVTPFLYVLHVFEKIFNTYGYALSKNELEEIDEIKRLCILNNYGVIEGDTFPLNRLLPDMSVMEFMDAILNKFNATLFINPENRSGQILLNDLLITQTPQYPMLGKSFLQNNIHSELSITHPVINDDFAKEPSDTLDAIAEKYDLEIVHTAFRHDPDLLSIFEENTNNQNIELKIYLFGSSQFAYWQRLMHNKNLEKSRYQRVFEPLGCLSHQLNAQSQHEKKIESKAAIHGNLDAKAQIFYRYLSGGGGVPDQLQELNRGSVFCASFQIGANDPETIFTRGEKPEDDFPLCLSIFRGKLDIKYDDDEPTNYSLSDYKSPFGSCFPFDRAGNLLAEKTEDEDVYHDTLSLQVMGEYGLLENFFKNTQAFYRDAGLPLQVQHFNPTEMLKHNLQHKALVESTECFISRIEVEISIFESRVVSVQGITAKPLV